MSFPIALAERHAPMRLTTLHPDNGLFAPFGSAAAHRRSGELVNVDIGGGCVAVADDRETLNSLSIPRRGVFRATLPQESKGDGNENADGGTAAARARAAAALKRLKLCPRPRSPSGRRKPPKCKRKSKLFPVNVCDEMTRAAEIKY